MTTVLKITYKEQMRRITVNDQNLTFAELTNSLGQIFEKLPKNWVLKYVDDEGDEISVSSDKELQEGLRLLKSLKTPTLRFTIASIKKNKSKEEKEHKDSNNNNDVASALGESIEQISKQFPFLEVFLENGQGRRCPFKKDKEEGHCGRRNHRAVCDNCHERIPFPGSRFKCNACPDFDLCEKCYNLSSRPHDNAHTFVEIKDPKIAVHTATCNSCNNRIVGERFKCTECADFDLCSACKHSPKNTHDAKHTFLLIEKPWRRCPRFAVPAEKKEVVPAVPVSVPEVKVEVPIPPVESKPIEIKEEKKEEKVPEILDPFTAKLAQLDDMGFTDRGRNIHLLMKHGGDLVAVVKNLLF